MATKTSDAVSKASLDIRRLQSFRVAGVYNWSLKDYSWFEPNIQTFNDPYDIQTIIMDEFQVDPMFDYMKALSNIFDNKNVAKTAEDGGGLSRLFLQGLSYIGEEALMSKYLSNPSSPIELPIRLIENLFAGHYLGRFQFPLLNNKDYLYADPGTWSTQHFNELMKGKANAALNNTNIDVKMLPTWSLGTFQRKINFELDLINNSTENLFKNFKMLHSLVAGAFWMQMDVLMRPPNIYRVIIPGRFVMLWATAAVTVELKGKLRKNAAVVDQINKTTQSFKEGAGAVPMTGIDYNTLFPDAYVIKIQLNDLLPTLNSYNTYMYYMAQGSKINIKSENPNRNKAGGILDIGSTWGKDILNSSSIQNSFNLLADSLSAAGEVDYGGIG